MSEIKEFTIEELKTAIGFMMSDLRSDWASNYNERLSITKNLLKELITRTAEQEAELKYLVAICDREARATKKGWQDGRAFRGQYLYEYESQDGCTLRVKNFLIANANWFSNGYSAEYNLKKFPQEVFQ